MIVINGNLLQMKDGSFYHKAFLSSPWLKKYEYGHLDCIYGKDCGLLYTLFVISPANRVVNDYSDEQEAINDYNELVSWLLKGVEK